MDVDYQDYMMMLRVSYSNEEMICSVKTSCAPGQFFAGPICLVPKENLDPYSIS